MSFFFMNRGLLVLLCLWAQAESAIIALNCSGMVVGTQPIRCEQNRFYPLRHSTSFLSYPYFLILQGKSLKDTCEVTSCSSNIARTSPLIKDHWMEPSRLLSWRIFVAFSGCWNICFFQYVKSFMQQQLLVFCYSCTSGPTCFKIWSFYEMVSIFEKFTFSKCSYVSAISYMHLDTSRL